MSRLPRILFLLSICLLSFTAAANRIDKGYAALSIHDYFKAKKMFTKALKYNKTAASQGLAIIFYRDNNPFHNYDSAYVYINQSIRGWDMEKLRKKDLWGKYGFTQDSLYSLRQAVSTQLYRIAQKKQTEESLTQFIEMNPWANEFNTAIATRDSIAFFRAVEMNSSEAYKAFADKYPNSVYAEIAQQNYFDSQYQEHTGDGSLESYVSFINNNPESPLKPQAEYHVFELSTSSNTPQVFQDFITTYPANAYRDTAWRYWYEQVLSDYSKENMRSFLNTTNVPFKERVMQDLHMFDTVILPFVHDKKYGFMNVDGISVIRNDYDFAGFFQEGLAVVVQNDKYGFINKHGEIQIACTYESASGFVNGRAVVEMNGKMGMIDRNGRFLFDCIYDDLGLFSDSLAYAQVGGRYGYYNENYQLAIPYEFDDAYDFNKGMAKVEKDGKQSFINKKGEFVVPLVYDEITPFYDTLYVYSDDGYYGIINHKAQIFLEPVYTSINEISNGYAVAAVEDRLVYLDTFGVMVIDNGYSPFPNYQLKGEFIDGIAIAYKKGKYGRINLKDEVVTKFEFQNIGFGTDYFPAKKEEKWGVFSANGKVLVSPIYDALKSIEDGNFIASKNDTLGIIDPNGNIVVAFAFEEIESLGGDLYLVHQNGKLGVYKGAQLIVPLRYDQIGIFDEDFLFLSREGDLDYFQIKEKKLVELIK